MQIPPTLSQAIQQITSKFRSPGLTHAVAELSATYRGERKGRPHLDEIHRAAYLLTRMPATYAVLTRILHECTLRVPDLRVESMLDLGAGPGTSLWAAAAHFPELTHATLVEDAPDWIAVCRQLARSGENVAVRNADWRQSSITDELPQGVFDLVSISYSLNELRSTEINQVLRSAWERTGKVLIIAEPGTPSGFELIRQVRAELIGTGACMAAPCPHANACPMRDGNWCHFAERVQRTAEHRSAKSGELGYEDEKYSYVVFARWPVLTAAARILRHPRKHSGHVELELCTVHGLSRETVSRKQGEKYKQAKKAEWGDEIQENRPPSAEF